MMIDVSRERTWSGGWDYPGAVSKMTLYRQAIYYPAGIKKVAMSMEADNSEFALGLASTELSSFISDIQAMLAPGTLHHVEFTSRQSDEYLFRVRIDAVIHFIPNSAPKEVKIVENITTFRYKCQYCGSYPEYLDRGRCPNCGAPYA